MESYNEITPTNSYAIRSHQKNCKTEIFKKETLDNMQIPQSLKKSKKADHQNFLIDASNDCPESVMREMHADYGAMASDDSCVKQDMKSEMFKRGPPPKEEQMRFEWLRLASFKVYQGNGNALKLARNGFYHDSSKGSSATRCIFCGVAHFTWEFFDDVIKQHEQMSPNCSFVDNTQAEINIPIYTKAIPGCEKTSIPSSASVNADDISVNILQTITDSQRQNKRTERTSTENKRTPEHIIQPTTQEPGMHRTENALNTSVEVILREMGYSTAIIEEAINTVKQQTDCSDVSLEQVLTWMFDNEEMSLQTSQRTLVTDTKRPSNRKKKKKKKATAQSATSSTNAASGHHYDKESLQRENEKLKEMQTCKICMDNPVNATLLPCAHLVTCETCAKKLRKCPICRGNIERIIKTFMA